MKVIHSVKQYQIKIIFQFYKDFKVLSVQNIFYINREKAVSIITLFKKLNTEQAKNEYKMCTPFRRYHYNW